MKVLQTFTVDKMIDTGTSSLAISYRQFMYKKWCK